MPSFTVSSSQVFDDLARNRAEARASRTLLAATQAFIATPQHDRQSKKQYSELVQHFFPRTKLEDRQSIAQLVCTCPMVPQDVLLLLCCDEESVACTILRQCEHLDEETLSTQILQGTTQRREAIACRDDITSNHASLLISFAEPSVLSCLEQHIDRLPEIADHLHDILGAESELAEVQKGSTSMGPTDRDYDKLVAEMERDWYEHYQPEELAVAEERMTSANGDAMKTALQPQEAAPPPSLNEPLPEPAPEPTLDDKLDMTSAEDDLAPAPKRFSFSIRADDEENAAIPPLEASPQNERSANIQFKRPMQEETVVSYSAAQNMAPQADEEQPEVHIPDIPASQSHDGPALTAQAMPETGTTQPAEPRQTEQLPTSSGRITFEIRASKDPAQSSVKKSPPPPLPTPVREESPRENLQLGPIPAPFVPRDIPQTKTNTDWEQALAHLSKPVDDLPKVRSTAKSPKRERSALPRVAPRPPSQHQDAPVIAPEAPTVQMTTEAPEAIAHPDREAKVSITRMQSAPILLTAQSVFVPQDEPAPAPTPAPSADISNQQQAQEEEREARISMPTGPRAKITLQKVAKETRQVAPKQVAPLASATEQAFLDKAALSKSVPSAATFEPHMRRESVLHEDSAPHGATIEAFAAKAQLAKPDFAHALRDARSNKPAPSRPANLQGNVAQQSQNGKAEISALLSDLKMIDPPQLKSGIPTALQADQALNPDEQINQTVNQASSVSEETAAPALSNHGFMPNMIELEDLDLVEAIPEMPSASQAMMDHQNARATPAIELIEPDEVVFAGDETAGDMSDQSPMMVVAAQIEAERAMPTTDLDMEQSQTHVPILQDSQSAAPANPILQVQVEEQEQMAEQLQQDAAQVHIAVRRQPQVDDLLNKSGDLTDLPELSNHQVIDAEDFSNLKASEQADLSSRADEQVRKISITPRPAGRIRGSMDQFLGFDEETRQAIMQSLISTTTRMDHTERFRRWPQHGRPKLAAKQATSLLVTRFSADDDAVAQVMHDISGHRKSDLQKLLQDPGGEALIAYLAFIGLDESRALSMALHAPDTMSHSYDKISKLMTLFDQMHPAASLNIVEQLLGKPYREQSRVPKHTPQLDEAMGSKSPRLRDSVAETSGTEKREPSITLRRNSGGKR